MIAIPAIVGIILIVVGAFLILTRNWSAEFHERWNQKFSWTRWATGPKAMQASRVANVVVGIVLMVSGIIIGTLILVVAK